MHLQEESYVHNLESGQICIAADKNNVGVHCANADCSNELLYLRSGTLKLLEMEDPDEQHRGGNSSFEMRFLPKKYFWLCGECAKKYVVKQWTRSGIVLEFRKRQSVAMQATAVADQSSDSVTPTQEVDEDALLTDMRSIA